MVTTEQLLVQVREAISATLVAIASGEGTVEYQIANRRHRRSDPAMVLASLERMEAKLNARLAMSGPRVSVAGLGVAGVRR